MTDSSPYMFASSTPEYPLNKPNSQSSSTSNLNGSSTFLKSAQSYSSLNGQQWGSSHVSGGTGPSANNAPSSASSLAPPTGQQQQQQQQQVRRVQSRHFDAFSSGAGESLGVPNAANNTYTYFDDATRPGSSAWGNLAQPPQLNSTSPSMLGSKPVSANTSPSHSSFAPANPQWVAPPPPPPPASQNHNSNRQLPSSNYDLNKKNNHHHHNHHHQQQQQGGIPGHAVTAPATPQSQQANGPPQMSSSVDEELIPTAIVIKNIPFAIKKEQLLEVMTTLGLPLPYAFNYHFDNGVFRGLAFANFTTPEETSAVISNLNGREIGGRKLRVEYKKMLPLVERERIEREKRERRGQLEEQHRGPQKPAHHGGAPVNGVPSKVDLNDPETLEFYSQLLLFRDDRVRNELVFPPTLTAHQRRAIMLLSSQLGLAAFGQDKSGSIVVSRGPQPPPNGGGGGGNGLPPLNQLPGQLGQQPPGLFDFMHHPQPQHAIPHHQAGQHPSLFPPQQPPNQLRGTKSFADIRGNGLAYPYNISAPGTPTGSPFFPSHTPPPQMNQGLAPLSLSLQQQRGANAPPLPPQNAAQSLHHAPPQGPPPPNLQSQQFHPHFDAQMAAFTDNFQSSMSLGGTPLSRSSAHSTNTTSQSTQADVSPTGSDAGVIGSKGGANGSENVKHDDDL